VLISKLCAVTIPSLIAKRNYAWLGQIALLEHSRILLRWAAKQSVRTRHILVIPQQTYALLFVQLILITIHKAVNAHPAVPADILQIGKLIELALSNAQVPPFLSTEHLLTDALKQISAAQDYLEIIILNYAVHALAPYHLVIQSSSNA
jgi:hypothetical protein